MEMALRPSAPSLASLAAAVDEMQAGASAESAEHAGSEVKSHRSGDHGHRQAEEERHTPERDPPVSAQSRQDSDSHAPDSAAARQPADVQPTSASPPSHLDTTPPRRWKQRLKAMNPAIKTGMAALKKELVDVDEIASGSSLLGAPSSPLSAPAHGVLDSGVPGEGDGQGGHALGTQQDGAPAGAREGGRQQRRREGGTQGEREQGERGTSEAKRNRFANSGGGVGGFGGGGGLEGWGRGANASVVDRAGKRAGATAAAARGGKAGGRGRALFLQRAIIAQARARAGQQERETRDRSDIETEPLDTSSTPTPPAPTLSAPTPPAPTPPAPTPPTVLSPSGDVPPTSYRPASPSLGPQFPGPSIAPLATTPQQPHTHITSAPTAPPPRPLSRAPRDTSVNQPPPRNSSWEIPAPLVLPPRALSPTSRDTSPGAKTPEANAQTVVACGDGGGREGEGGRAGGQQDSAGDGVKVHVRVEEGEGGVRTYMWESVEENSGVCSKRTHSIVREHIL